MSGRLTHLSPDGLGTSLGQAQVLAVSERLQALGWQCTILSLEPVDVPEETLDRIKERTGALGIHWQHRRYRTGSSGALRNAQSMASMIWGARGGTDLYLCRSYVGAFFPCVADLIDGAPYVFDTRGYWVDEKIEAGRWFQDPATRAIARGVERELYKRATGVVCLTELAARDVRDGRFGRRHSEERSICIPTCVDYDKFELKRAEPPNEFLAAGPVIGYVGSLNPSYEFRKSLQLAALILKRHPQAKFLALTNQVSEMSALSDEYGLPSARRLIRSVDHDRIHRWLPWIDFGLMLLVEPNQAKRASMPTKLAEFLATGVAPLAHGANPEVTHWVERAGSGFALGDLSEGSLQRAAEFVTQSVRDEAGLARARLVAKDHFSLDSGARRYDALFRSILS